MGSVQYRRGEIPECETSFLNAKRIDPNLVEAYLGLARVYRTALLYRRAYDQLKRPTKSLPKTRKCNGPGSPCCRGANVLRRSQPTWLVHIPTTRRKRLR